MNRRFMKLLTLARNLKRRKARERQSLFVAEGVRAVEELLASGLSIEGVLTAPQLADIARGAALRGQLAAGTFPVLEVSELEFRTAAETDSPQGVLAIGHVPARSFELVNTEKPVRLLVLDGVQDPGNLGTILRSCAALGVSGTVALPGTVDLWNPKVVRAAMGAHFRHLAFHATPEELFEFLDRENVQLVGTASGGTDVNAFSPPPRLALAVGNEGAGLSDSICSRAAMNLSIRTDPGVESLNVAVATGILLYVLRP